MKTKTLLLVAVCGTVFVALIALCTGAFVYSFRSMDSAVSPAIDELFAAIENDSFAETYDTHTSAELQQVMTREQYEELGRAIKTRLGALKSKSLRQFNVRQSNATRYANVTYNAVFENGSGTIQTAFKQDGEQWLLVGIHVNSPEFLKDLATGQCPHCGEPHAANAKFCSKCGKPLENEEASAASKADAAESP